MINNNELAAKENGYSEEQDQDSNDNIGNLLIYIRKSSRQRPEQ